MRLFALLILVEFLSIVHKLFFIGNQESRLHVRERRDIKTEMQTNPEKFQAVSVGQRPHSEIISFDLNGISISCEDEVKLLGVTIDFKLNFNSHSQLFVRRLQGN